MPHIPADKCLICSNKCPISEIRCQQRAAFTKSYFCVSERNYLSLCSRSFSIYLLRLTAIKNRVFAIFQTVQTILFEKRGCLDHIHIAAVKVLLKLIFSIRHVKRLYISH